MGRSQLILESYTHLPLVTAFKTATSTGAGSTSLVISATAGQLWIVLSEAHYHDDVAARTVYEKLVSAGGDACILATGTAIAGQVLRPTYLLAGLPVPIVLAGSRSITITVDGLNSGKIITSHLCYYRMTGLGTWTDT